METANTAPGHGPGEARTDRGPRAGRLVLVLAGLTAVAPLATDMYVPAFPLLADALGASSPAVQLSLTGFLVGLAVGQVVLGPLSDAVGRRPVLLAGAVAFTLLSVVCAVAPGIVLLGVARLLQGVAGAAGMVVARAVISDRFDGVEAARRFATLSVIVFVAPVVAPLAGGLILGAGSWRLVFAVLAGFGVLLAAGVVAWVPESLPPAVRGGTGVRSTLSAMGGLLREPGLVGHVVVLAFGGAALFAYIAGSSFVFQDLYGLSPTGYGFVFATNAAAMLVAGVLFGRLAGRMPLATLLRIGTGTALLAAATLTVLLLAGVSTLPTTWLCLLVTTAGLGMMLPAATTVAQAIGRRAPGATSGLVGGAQFVLGAAAAPVTGAFGVASATPTAAVVLVSLLVAAVALGVTARSAGHR